MSQQRPLALAPYRSPEQFHGPCYVLDAEVWNTLGWREVVMILPAKIAPPKREKVVVYPRMVCGTRHEPRWHDAARALRARGRSIRQIMAELRLVNYAAVYQVCQGR